jgi:peptide/nickel transport system permease protein
MMPKFVLLPTDIVIVVLLAALTFYLIHVARSEELKARWRYVVSSGASLCSLSLLCFFLLLSVVDSVHFRPVIDVQAGRPIYDVKAYSLLDKALGKASSAEEKSYSMPLATQTFEKISRFEDGKPVRDYEPLKAGGAHLKNNADYSNGTGYPIQI